MKYVYYNDSLVYLASHTCLNVFILLTKCLFFFCRTHFTTHSHWYHWHIERLLVTSHIYNIIRHDTQPAWFKVVFFFLNVNLVMTPCVELYSYFFLYTFQCHFVYLECFCKKKGKKKSKQNYRVNAKYATVPFYTVIGMTRCFH